MDARLAQLNLEYDSKRQSRRLQPLQVHALQPGCAAAYKEHQLARGMREAQYKVLPLQYQHELEFAVQDFVKQ